MASTFFADQQLQIIEVTGSTGTLLAPTSPEDTEVWVTNITLPYDTNTNDAHSAVFILTKPLFTSTATDLPFFVTPDIYGSYDGIPFAYPNEASNALGDCYQGRTTTAFYIAQVEDALNKCTLELVEAQQGEFEAFKWIRRLKEEIARTQNQLHQCKEEIKNKQTAEELSGVHVRRKHPMRHSHKTRDVAEQEETTDNTVKAETKMPESLRTTYSPGQGFSNPSRKNRLMPFTCLT